MKFKTFSMSGDDKREETSSRKHCQNIYRHILDSNKIKIKSRFLRWTGLSHIKKHAALGGGESSEKEASTRTP